MSTPTETTRWRLIEKEWPPAGGRFRVRLTNGSVCNVWVDAVVRNGETYPAILVDVPAAWEPVAKYWRPCDP